MPQVDESPIVATDDLDALLGQGEEYFLPPQVEPDECVGCGAEHEFPLCPQCIEERWGFIPTVILEQATAYLEFHEAAGTFERLAREREAAAKEKEAARA